MADVAVTSSRSRVGVWDIPLVFVAPRRLFSRVENVGAYGWVLVLLLTAVTMVGWATVQTGLISLEVERGVRARIAAIDAGQRDVVERSALRELYERERKMGEFWEMMTNMQVIVAEPVKALASALLIAAVLYGAVALTGRKPEWHTLLSICVYAGYIDLLRLVFMLVLMLRFGTLAVDTSLAVAGPVLLEGEIADKQQVAAITGALSGVDPFRIWYWAVLLIGLSATAQLRGWRAWLAVGLCWLVSAGVSAGMAAATVAQAAPAVEASMD